MNYIDTLMQVARGEQDASAPGVQLAAQAERARRMTQRVVLPYIPNCPPKIAFIGECVGPDELRDGKPFAGRVEQELRRWCVAAGVNLDDCYLDNVYPFERADDLSAAEKEDAREACVERVVMACLQSSALLVPLGEEALTAFESRYAGILKYRGSILTLRGMRAMPMLNPASVLRKTQWRRRCLLDMQEVARIAREGWHVQQFDHTLVWVDQEEEQTNKKLQKHIEILANLSARPEEAEVLMAIDIETAALDGRITCIGFSSCEFISKTYQWPHNSDTSLRAQLIRELVKALCESPCRKVLHNGLYDAWWLKRYAGINVVNWQVDTMGMAQVVCPTDNISLEYLTSLLPERPIPYYKDEGKDHFGHAPKDETGWRQLMTYCGRDAIATLRVYSMLNDRFDAAQMWDVYYDNYPSKFAPMLDLMLEGVDVDAEAQAQAREFFLRESRTARDALTPYNGGEPLFTLTTQRDKRVWSALQAQGRFYVVNNIGIPKTTHTYYSEAEINKALAAIDAKIVSHAKLKTLLYDKLNLPLQTKKRVNKEETPTSDNLTLRKLMLEHPDNLQAQEVLRLAIQAGKQHKLAEFCYENKLDVDGRFRFSLKFTPETGRFASSKAPNGRGGNSQNQPHIKEIRSLFLPDPGHVILKIDMSQIESRICFLYTRDPELVRLAQLRSTEWDGHSENAVTLGLVDSPIGVPYAQRQLAKKVVHGAQRNMQAETLQDNLLKDSDVEKEVVLPSLEECAELLESYHRRYPAIRESFFEETRRKMQTGRWLTNSWGRRWGLPYEDLDEEAMRRAFSFLLQSEAADLINRQGFVPMWHWLRYVKTDSRILLHIHDELVFSCPADQVWSIAEQVRWYIEEPHRICDVDFSAPIEYGVGSSWAVSKEWKELPSRDEMVAYAQDCVRR